MSPNRRHTVGFAMAEKEDESYVDGTQSLGQHSNIPQDGEHATFETGDEFMTGTPLTPGYISGTGKMPQDDDKSMTEF